jgi:3-deoxy-manno-octulosonate cytidylyltransferase (CMP-KDO synthetase)
MKFLGVIPARFGSTRFPGKPLEFIAGKPLLQWVLEGARESRTLSEIWVATDDERIAKLARSLKAPVSMTDSSLPTGSDRVWKTIENLDVDVVVNIQGDEPLLRGALLDQLVAPFAKEPDLQMATLGRPLTQEALLSPNTAKIVVNKNDEALYFSRFAIPYSRLSSPTAEIFSAALKHVGIYAYSKKFLREFCAQAPVPIEIQESLEQLRALYLGAKIKVVRTEHDSWGVDTPEDVAKIEALLKEKHR